MSQNRKTKGFSTEALKRAVEACDHNVTLYQKEIEKEIDKKSEYQHLIEDIEQGGEESKKPGAFGKEVLERGVEECDRNIKKIEEAIEGERETQKEYRRLIEEAERMERKRQMVAKGEITIEAEHEE